MTSYSKTPLATESMLMCLQEEDKALPVDLVTSNEIIQHLASQIKELEKFISWASWIQDDEEGGAEWWID